MYKCMYVFIYMYVFIHIYVCIHNDVILYYIGLGVGRPARWRGRRARRYESGYMYIYLYIHVCIKQY